MTSGSVGNAEGQGAERDRDRGLRPTEAGSAIVEGSSLRIRTADSRLRHLLSNGHLPDLEGRRVDEVLGSIPERVVRRAARTGSSFEAREMACHVPERGRIRARIGIHPLPDTSDDGSHDLLVLVEDVTRAVEARRRDADLRQRLERLDSIFTALPEGLVLVDHGGEIVRSNPAAERILGDAARDLCSPGGSLELRTPDGVPVPPEEWPLGRLLRGETLSGVEAQLANARTGEERWVIIAGTTVAGVESEGPFALILVKDVTAMWEEDAADSGGDWPIGPWEARRALTELEQRYHLVGDLIPYGVWVASSDGRIRYVSDSFLQLVGKTLEQVQREGWLDCVPAGEREDIRAGWIGNLRSRQPWDLEYAVRGVDGRDHHILSRGIPVHDDGGPIRSWVGLNLDMSERRQAEIDLQRAKDEAEAANRAKDRFLAILSHELRTPLTPLMMAAQLLEEDPLLPEKLRPTVGTLKRNAELEARLIDDLLDISRIAQGKMTLVRERLDLHSLVEAVVGMCHDELRRSRLHVMTELGAERSLVQGDAARLQQVLWNLLKNAVKFTPEGGHVTVRTLDEGDRVVVEVTDTGTGIPADQLALVFDTFNQGSRERAADSEGLGLGLAIAKALVELHGGSIEARSEGPGKGTTMRILLPVAEGRPSMEAPPRPRTPALARDGSLRILLVDDHDDTLELLSMALARHGYEVLTARDMGSALELAAREPFDVLVSDIGLPDGTGLDLMEELERDGAVTGIALTGFGAEADVQRSREAGFREHITKPVGVKALLAAIERITG